ncbi:universal stress protein [Halalkalicoccus sp. NIPERK01]|uniref:universal stress protein n=1 Tax=Halalkalicoccus sp. NIPERK01 TaxID=3053469 RepID=UPI00256F1545|nr:universal stress protein [Halalkalicoccus sp. NIPERK01]MDL5363447.1 universal stress protein [Halalkalicoccus sp. NIPERK01]
MVVIAAVDSQATGSAVVSEGRTLADAMGEPLHVVHVLNQSRFRELERTSLDETGEPIDVETIREMATDIADDVASATLETGYTAVGLVGDPAEAVLKYAANEDASYLAIGGRKRSKVGKALFGSVTQSVLLDADVPVLTVMSDDD